MAAATMYVTPAGANGKTGVDWANAFGLAEWEADVEDSMEAGDKYYVYSGTYTLTNAFATTRDGPAHVIGVSDQGTPPTRATGDDRPLIACGAYQFSFDNAIYIHALRLTGTAENVLHADTNAQVVDCKAENTSGTANRVAFQLATGRCCIGCEGISTKGYAFYVGGHCRQCYAHDSHIGFYISGATIDCIADTCTDGIYQNVHTEGCTIYGCTTGIRVLSTVIPRIKNNIIKDCTTGISSGSTLPDAIVDHNNYHGNTNNVLNITEGPNATAHDPQFVDAPTEIFAWRPAVDASVQAAVWHWASGRHRRRIKAHGKVLIAVGCLFIPACPGA